MISKEDNSLHALETLMNEFFSTNVTNQRKYEIEQVLNSFSKQNDCWKQCLYFMVNSSNEYVIMYVMTAVEDVINKRWISLQGADRIEIRSTLNQFLLMKHNQMAAFLRNKLAKLVVDIGRLDWPHFYPDFFSSILQAIQQSDTVVLGLVLLQTASEELVCPREDLSVTRKKDLKRLLLDQVPTILKLLNELLDSLYHKHPAGTVISNSNNSIFQKNYQEENICKDFITIKSNSDQLISYTLSCLSHLFTWIPLAIFGRLSLIKTLFLIAELGCDVNNRHHNLMTSLSIKSVCCINELLSKNCIPVQFEPFLLEMFSDAFNLVQFITKDVSMNSSGNLIKMLDENYIDELTELLRLFVNNHIKRLEENDSVKFIEFLKLLNKYTFKQTSNEGLFSCLDIWMTFLDYLKTKSDTRISNGDNMVEKYEDTLELFATKILQQFQFQVNQNQLIELDDEALDDNNETEWQRFLRQCLEIVAKLSDVIPAKMFRLVYQSFNQSLQVYLGLEGYISNAESDRQFTIKGESDCRRLHSVLKDLASLLQAIGRISGQFDGELFEVHFKDAYVLIESLVNAAVFGTSCKLFNVKTEADALTADFIDVHAQVLATIKAYSGWLTQFHIKTQTSDEQKQKSASVITLLLKILIQMLKEKWPSKIIHSAAHLMVSLMCSVRPYYLMQMDIIQSLFSEVTSGLCKDFSMEIQLLLHRCLFSHLILPWSGIPESEQNWSIREQYHANFTKEFFNEYYSIKTMKLQQNALKHSDLKSLIKKMLFFASDVVEAVSNEGVTKSKQICFKSLENFIQDTLIIFPQFINDLDIAEPMMSFFLTLFNGLHKQMGLLSEQILQIFTNMFTSEQVLKTISVGSEQSSRIMEKYLNILEVLVLDKQSKSSVYIPSIMKIVMVDIYPIVAERSSPDIKPELISVMHEILHHNWQYFFSGIVRKDDQQKNQYGLKHEAEFNAIMKAFGQTFLQTDIRLFKQVLSALENLNYKWQLYKKQIFIDSLSHQFITVLVQVLLQKSHDLLQEEIITSIYNMAAVNFEVFFSHYLPQFLSGCEHLDNNQKSILLDNFKTEKDLPSFIQNLSRFVNDFRYYQLCNSNIATSDFTFS